MSLPLAAAPSAEQSKWLSSAKRIDQDGWIYVHIEGDPRQRGYQHGYLLANEIVSGLAVRRTEWEHNSTMSWTWLINKARTMVVPKVDAEDLAEMEGIATGMTAAGKPVTRDEIVTYNDYFDLAWSWWPIEKKKSGSDSPEPPHQSCSAFIATGHMTADGKIVLAHNTMFEYAAKPNVVIDLVPAKGHRILMQAFPGYIHSAADFFVTDAGLVGTETTITYFEGGFDEKGIPEFVRMRRAMQDASSIDEWVAIMRKGNNGAYANLWLVGDVNTNEIARLELGRKYIGLDRTKDGYFTGSNYPETPKILRLETSLPETDIRLTSVARRVRWNQLMAENRGTIDVEKAKAFEADHYDTYVRKEVPGPRTICGHFELDPVGTTEDPPWNPGGTIDAKVIDSTMARRLMFVARWGSACGTPFDAGKFLDEHPQFDWMRGILYDRPSEPWTTIRAGM